MITKGELSGQATRIPPRGCIRIPRRTANNSRGLHLDKVGSSLSSCRSETFFCTRWQILGNRNKRKQQKILEALESWARHHPDTQLPRFPAHPLAPYSSFEPTPSRTSLALDGIKTSRGGHGPRFPSRQAGGQSLKTPISFPARCGKTRWSCRAIKFIIHGSSHCWVNCRTLTLHAPPQSRPRGVCRGWI